MRGDIMEKITRFRDIPSFTRDGSWQCDFDFVYLLQFIDEHIKEYNLQLNPDFQRGHVWTEEQQIAWIEFFLRGGKTVHGLICKPTGKKDEQITVNGNYDICWKSCGNMKYYIVAML